MLELAVSISNFVLFVFVQPIQGGLWNLFGQLETKEIRVGSLRQRGAAAEPMGQVERPRPMCIDPLDIISIVLNSLRRLPSS